MKPALMRRFLAELADGAVPRTPTTEAVAKEFRRELGERAKPGRPRKEPAFGEMDVLLALAHQTARGLPWGEAQRWVAREFGWSSGAASVRRWLQRNRLSRSDVKQWADMFEFTFTPGWKRLAANIEQARRAGVDPRTPLSALR